MSPRFWVDHPLTTGIHELCESEAHHARNVLRLTLGAVVEVFDGDGAWAAGVLQRVEKKQVVVQVESVQTTPQRLPRVVLATAVPKGERMDWLVEKATELGVSRLIPLKTSRSTVDPRDSKLDRLRGQVVAACKQCRRNDLMEIAPVVGWNEFVAEVSIDTPFFVAHPGGASLGEMLPPSAEPIAAEVVIAIGPEGGWTDEEVAVAEQRGARRMSLGPLILRIETAALAAAAWMAGLRNDGHQDF